MRKAKTIAPSETYVRLMDAIQDSIKEAESKELDYEKFLKHIPMEGPWARLDGNDEAKDNPIERYVGPGKARLMNTNLFLGSSWIDTQRFKFERRIDTPADFIRQKTVVNANMWTPKQVSTTVAIGERCARGFCENPLDCPQCAQDSTCYVIPGRMCAGTCYGTCVKGH